MKKSMNKLAIAAAIAGTAAITAPVEQASAANWLMLQGTEVTGTAGRAKVWGFIQPEAQMVDGTTVQGGKWKGSAFQPNTIGPDRVSRATMNIRRARIGVRGQGFPLDNKTNYFILSELGHNGINVPGGGGGAVYLTDASVTLNHVPFARLRVGQFKYPGSEEGLQAIHVFDYINFTNGTDQLLLERFADGDGSDTVNDPVTAKNAGHVNKPNGGVGAFRDIGAQLFDTVKLGGGMELSYAAMIGNGNGINRQDNNGAKDYYTYLAFEKVFGGKGPRIEGAKAYYWNHMGKRTLTEEKVGTYDRNRSGAGFTYRKGLFRAAGEYMMADGLIRNGTDGGAKIGSVSSDGIPSSLNYEVDGEAHAYYADFGFKADLGMGIPFLKNMEIDVRYDHLARMTNVEAKERHFTTTTIGAQYFVNKKTRIVFNYEMRGMEVPNPDAIEAAMLKKGANANQAAAVKKNAVLNAEGIDDRISVQLLAIF